MKQVTKRKLIVGSTAFLAGFIVNYLGDRILGVHLELFYGLHTFSFLWILDLFFVPFLAGLVVGIIYGKGGKLLCYFPPLFVRAYNYYLFTDLSRIPEGASLIPLGWWGFFVIVAMEAAAIGGIMGEIVIKKHYGRRPRNQVFKEKNS